MTCICQPGFTGHFCDVDINECASGPCQHNGTCIDLINQYLCLCQDGYEGMLDCRHIGVDKTPLSTFVVFIFYYSSLVFSTLVVSVGSLIAPL